MQYVYYSYFRFTYHALHICNALSILLILPIAEFPSIEVQAFFENLSLCMTCYYYFADPYIKLVVKYKEKILYEWKSYVKRCTVSPVFNESFSYEIEDLSIAFDIENVQLLFYVLDNDFFMQDTSIGVVKIGKGVNICSSGRNHWIKALQYPSECISSWHPIQPVQ